MGIPSLSPSLSISHNLTLSQRASQLSLFSSPLSFLSCSRCSLCSTYTHAEVQADKKEIREERGVCERSEGERGDHLLRTRFSSRLHNALTRESRAKAEAEAASLTNSFSLSLSITHPHTDRQVSIIKINFPFFFSSCSLIAFSSHLSLSLSRCLTVMSLRIRWAR